MPFSRLTATKCSIADVLSGAFVARSDSVPATVVTSYGALARVNLLAALVAAEGDRRFVLEDGTGRVAVRAFTPLPIPPVGSVVQFIGRPREFAGERYLVPDLVRVLQDPGWVAVRQAELARRVPSDAVPTSQVAQAELAPDPLEALVDTVRRLDSGNGAPTEQVLDAHGPGSEERLQTLLAQGDVFEVRPGFLKVLE